MKKLITSLLVMALSLLLISGLVLAQTSHGNQKSDSLKSAMSHRMMKPMQQEMRASGMMQGGMMEKGKMQKSKMGHEMMKCDKMGKGMMHGQKDKEMMNMNDPVIKALHSNGCPGFLLKIADKLNLSDQQLADLKALKSEMQKFSVKNNADIKVAKIELNELVDSEKPDFGKVKSKISQIGSFEQTLRLEFLNVVQKSRNLLTNEQLKKLNSLPKGSGMGMMHKSKM